MGKCKNEDCGCQNGLTTPAPCPPSTPCGEYQPCVNYVNTRCVQYTGDDIMCNEEVVVEQGAMLEDFLPNLVERICNSSTQCNSLSISVSYEEDILTAVVTGGTAPYTYEWVLPTLGSFGAGHNMLGATNANTLLTENNTHISEVGGNRIYTTMFKLIVTDSNGCIKEEYYTLTTNELIA